ncbi:MAG: hypothetical protein K6G56_06930 [Clostridiales bacterium]|nr:hypothetical protein [Clostridiales bacterium]
MKKLISLIIAAVMLLTTAAAPVYASGKPVFKLTGPTSASVGDTIKYTLSIEGEYSVHIINLLVFFDNTSLRFVKRRYLDVADEAREENMVVSDVTTEGNAVSLGIMMMKDPLSTPGDLIEITFEVLPTAKESAFLAMSVREFAFMPVGEQNSTPCEYETQNITVRLSGGTGSDPTPTPIPGPGEHGKSTPTPDPNATQTAPVGAFTPAPTETEKPAGYTDPPATPVPTNTDEPARTSDPSDTDDPADRSETPEETADPNETEEPGVSGEPVDTDDPAVTEEPSVTESADPGQATEVPGGDDEPAPKRSNVGWYAGGGALLLAGITALVIVLAKKKKKNK